MLISSFLQPSTSRQGLEQRHFGLTCRQRDGGFLRQAIMYGQYALEDKSNGKQKLK